MATPITKELIEALLQELNQLRESNATTDIKALVEDIGEIKEDLSEIKRILLNPETGLVVKVNKNTEFREKKAEKIEEGLANVKDILKWRDGVTKALWIIFASLIGLSANTFFGLIP